MKITSIDIFQLRWFGLMPAWHPIVIRVNTDKGIQGFGESGLAYGRINEGMVGTLSDLSKVIIDRDPLQSEKIWADFYQTTFWAKGGDVVLYAAVSAIDTALWDIKGKLLNVPVYQLLGGKTRDKISAYASQIQFDWDTKVRFLKTPAEYAQVAKKVVNQGYTTIKIDPFMIQGSGKIAHATHGLLTNSMINDYYSRLKAIRHAVGPDINIILECHANLTANSAIQFIKKCHDLNLYYIEEPCSPMNPDIMNDIKDTTGAALASGERIATRFHFSSFIHSRSLNVIQPDIGICGGITEARKISDMADTNDIDVQFHVCGSPIATAVALQLEAVIPNSLIHEYHEISLKPQNIASGLYDYHPIDGYFKIPDKPGIGQALSDDAMTSAVKTTID